MLIYVFQKYCHLIIPPEKEKCVLSYPWRSGLKVSDGVYLLFNVSTIDNFG